MFTKPCPVCQVRREPSIYPPPLGHALGWPHPSLHPAGTSLPDHRLIRHLTLPATSPHWPLVSTTITLWSLVTKETRYRWSQQDTCTTAIDPEVVSQSQTFLSQAVPSLALSYSYLHANGSVSLNHCSCFEQIPCFDSSPIRPLCHHPQLPDLSSLSTLKPLEE